jgi:hypothetical protein
MKNNLTLKKKEGEEKVGTFLRLPVKLKERAQIWCVRNNKSLADLAAIGIEKIIGK